MHPDPEDDDPLPGPDTQNLLRRARQGDDPSLDTLILTWDTRVRQYTSGTWCGGIAKEDLHDIKIDTIYQLIDEASPTATSVELETLLLRTVRDRVRKLRKGDRNRRRIEGGIDTGAPEPMRLHQPPEEAARHPPEPITPVIPPGTSWVNPDLPTQKSDIKKRDVRKVLVELAPEEREILSLRIMNEVPLSACREIMQLPDHYCRELLQLAKKSFLTRYLEIQKVWTPA